jgi:SAM-dependent methyltransferase
VLHDLNVLPYPFEDNEFDEIHAYEVLEHCGRQGDWRYFFDQWAEFWRIVKPGGHFCGTCPHRTSPWAWGDPSHTRIIGLEQLVFLSQKEYERQVGKLAMSDFRHYYKADWELVWENLDEGLTQQFVLRAVKPSSAVGGR